MAKLIILSVVIVSFFLPVGLSTKAQPSRELRRLQWMMFAFVIVWAYTCLIVYPQMVELK